MNPTIFVGNHRVTPAVGPGLRWCLWVRGCSMHCPGCGTPEYIPAGLPSHNVPIEALYGAIDAALEERHIEGVSFSGGEPFEQAAALAHVAAYARSKGLSTLSWSGYTRKHLEGSHAPPGSREFLRELDVLIDGPFRKDLVAIRAPLRGSTNQVIHLLTDRYCIEDVSSAFVEMCIAPDGSVQTTGVMPYELFDAAMAMFGIAVEKT